jgi:hypothetical protein
MSDSLRHFMVTLATDVDALAAFIMDAIKAIKAAGLTEEDATVLTSGDQTRIYVALSGIKLPIATQPAAEQNALSACIRLCHSAAKSCLPGGGRLERRDGTARR